MGKEDPLAVISSKKEGAFRDEHGTSLVDIPINSQPPPYQKVAQRGGDDHDDDEKVCRICLEDDLPEQMIAPCKCKGGSKWVHRECLDEWRLNEKDRAFSQCTECLFQYHMQPIHPNQHENAEWRRKMKFYMLVSRDVCFLTILSQVVIVCLGGFVALCDPDMSIPSTVNNGSHPMGAYYLCGWFALLVLLGLYGSVTLCANGCSPSKALENHISQQEGEQSADTYTRYDSNRSTAYRQRRHHRRHHGCYYHPVYFNSGPGGDCCCCCYCPGDGHSRSSTGSDCSCDCCPSGGGSGGSGGGGNDGMHILMIVLLVVAIIMAVIGFFVGLVITVIIGQRIVQRHVYLLHKRQLVQEFQVLDLAGYDLNQEKQLPANISAPPSTYDVEHQPLSPPAPPSNLLEKDVSYLEKLGLIDRS